MDEINWVSPDCYARREGDRIHFGNDYAERLLSIKDNVLRTEALINKRTGKIWSLQTPYEGRLVFAANAPRIDIPCWRYTPGSPESVNPSDDCGYRSGHHKPDFDDNEWRYVDCFSAVGESPRGDTESVWPGYGWFRACFSLPEAPAGRPLYLTLGGYDNEDWQYYRVFLNGIEIGYREMSGRWREPEPFVVAPGDEAHTSIIHPGKNLLAVQTGRLDKRLPAMVPGEAEHYKFGSRVVDQYITLGEPLVSVEVFAVRRWIVGGDRHFLWLRIMADSPAENLRLTFHYQVRSGEPYIRKKMEIRNSGMSSRLLLDVDVESWELDGDTDDGGFGFPIILDGQAYCALEHPAGLNQGLEKGVILRHFPGVTLHPRQGTTSQTSLFGVGEEGGAVDAFHEYLRHNGKRKKEWIAIYDPLGLVDTCHPWEERYHFTEQVALDTVTMLEELQSRGIRFDSYIIDHGWEDHGSDLTWFKPDEFPNGPDKLIQGIHGLGMEFGLWFSGTYASWACGDYPPARQSVVPRISGAYDLCPASEPYRSILRNAMLHHIRKHHVKAMKIDMARFYCNSTEHGHLPGKYSVEAQIESVLETVRILHRECPELFIIWYWGFNSPFWLLYGSTLFDKKLLMEAAAVASSPHPCYRASTTHNLDQAARHARFIPLESQDSLGIWIGDVDWCNHMGKEDWREAWLLDLARGNMMIQLWGDLTLLDDDDIAFAAEWFSFVRENSGLYANTMPILGNPWKGEVYGYAAGNEEHAVVTIHNPGFPAAEVSLRLDGGIGLSGKPQNGDFVVRQLYPEKGLVKSPPRESSEKPLRSGEELVLALHPFEVVVLEIGRGLETGGWPICRETPPVASQKLNATLELMKAARVPSPQPQRSDVTGYSEKSFRSRIELPDIAGSRSLAFMIRLSRLGEHWYHKEISSLFSVEAAIGAQKLTYRKTPAGFTMNGPGSPWLLFDMAVDAEHSGKTLDIEAAALLPEEIDWQLESWLYRP